MTRIKVNIRIFLLFINLGFVLCRAFKPKICTKLTFAQQIIIFHGNNGQFTKLKSQNQSITYLENRFSFSARSDDISVSILLDSFDSSTFWTHNQAHDPERYANIRRYVTWSRYSTLAMATRRSNLCKVLSCALDFS